MVDYTGFSACVPTFFTHHDNCFLRRSFLWKMSSKVCDLATGHCSCSHIAVEFFKCRLGQTKFLQTHLYRDYGGMKFTNCRCETKTSFSDTISVYISMCRVLVFCRSLFPLQALCNWFAVSACLVADELSPRFLPFEASLCWLHKALLLWASSCNVGQDGFTCRIFSLVKS